MPIEEGIAVFNVETIYNTYRCIEKQQPVIDKLVTINGEVREPVTVRVPIGMAIEDVVSMAGDIMVKEPVYLVGGPMMGNICHGEEPITKTTNAILVLDHFHCLVCSKNRSSSIDLKRAASVCCQCQMCTDLCPRHALGHPIEPHRFMRSASNKDFQDTNIFLNTMFCSSCGLCEVYSCPQGLSPRSLIAEYKNGLRSAGIKSRQDIVPTPVSDARAYRKMPEERLQARLGLSKYTSDAVLDNHAVEADSVEILLNRHIGAPSNPVVSVGSIVKKGQVIAEAGKGLSVNLHASISGIVVEVKNKYIKIQKNSSTERM